MSSLELARLRLVNLVHAADQRHFDGLHLSPRDLLELAEAIAEVSRLQGRPLVVERAEATR
jgi:hypothetical protein